MAMISLGESTTRPTLRIGSRFIDRRHVIVAFVALLFVLFLSFAVRATYAESDNVSRTGRHVLTVYDDGVEKGVLTEANTLRGALDQAGIEVGDNDVTEPSLDEELVAATYDVNIYRARPVSIHDGAVVMKVMTPYRSAQQIAKQVGLSLHTEDVVSLESSNDVVSDGAIERLVVDRATPVSFTFYGDTKTAYTQGVTVGEMLTAKGIELGENDKVSPSLDTPITAGMEVNLWREGTQTVTRDEAIEYPTREIQDADHPVGYRKVTTEGVDGARTVTYEITMKNGVEVAKKEINAVVHKEATEEVVVVGIKVELPAGSHEDWMAAAGIASSDYGYVNYIVGRESGWSPTKSNYAGSGAYGLCQALPASKMSSAGGDYLTNPITQLKWCNGYAVGRYGSWYGAWKFWQTHNWW